MSQWTVSMGRLATANLRANIALLSALGADPNQGTGASSFAGNQGH